MQLKLIVKALWIGATMTIPGVSGGTMAVVTGIYEDLIHAVNGFRKEPKKYIGFLLQFVISAGAGFLLLARLVTWLLEQPQLGEITKCFFCGVVFGGVPLLVKKADIHKWSVSHILCLLLGAGIVLGLGQIPQGLFSTGTGFVFYLLQLVGGFLIAIAFVLPGISTSHMLYILGLYEVVLQKAYAFRFWELIPLAIGGILGTFLTADGLEKLLERYPSQVYMAIVGFVAGSVVTLLPIGGFHQILWDVVVCVAGFVSMFLISGKGI